MKDRARAQRRASDTDFQEASGRSSVVAFFLGIAIVAGSVVLGRTYPFYFLVFAFALFATILWTKTPRPWILLVSLAAATPVPLFKQNVAANLIFAFWLIVFNVKYLFRLPPWVYAVTGLAFLGVLTSSAYWMPENVIGGLLRQGAFAYNFLLAPFILLPAIYFRMQKSDNHSANLQGLLYFLVLPSTLLLLVARYIGSPANVWEASLHVQGLAEGYIQYQIGKVVVNLQRTEVGFILSALICASTAIAVSPVKALDRFAAGACLLSNIFLLFVTGSFGSGFACLCGLAAIFYAQLRAINGGKWLASMAAIVGMLLLIFALLPPNVKGYLGRRYEQRVTNANEDRLLLWERDIDYFLEHPGGVGLTFLVGDRLKTNPHNDYLLYTVSYGPMGGLAYTLLVLGMLVYFLRSGNRKNRDPSALAVHLAGLGVIVGLAINSMTDDIGNNRWYFNVIWSMAWYCYFCSRAARRQTVLGETGAAKAPFPNIIRAINQPIYAGSVIAANDCFSEGSGQRKP
ncbi:MAG: O-antigen ligase family protein [Syntrophorhabdales bacterium]